MVKPRRKLCFSERSPQFFKVFLPNLCSLRLRIPPAFIKYFNGVLPHKSTITSPAKRSWHVDVNKVGDNLYLDKGWQQFVQDNSLEFGDFLIFYYGGNAKFYVKIFGKNGCRKDVNDPTRDSHTAYLLHQENQTLEHRKSSRLALKTSSKEVTEKDLSPRVKMEIREDDRALKEASKFVSKFPFFQVVMNNTYVSSGLMNIPASFVRRNMEKGRRSATLLVSDKLWPVKLARCREGTVCRFSGGWPIFCKENTIKIGDVCVFELIERNDFVLKVSIFRCLD